MKTIIIGASGIIGYKLFKTLKERKIKVIGTYSKNKKPELVKFNILKDNVKKKIKINEEDNVIILTAISNPTWVYKNPKPTKLSKKIINTVEIVNLLNKEKINNSENHFLFSLISTNAFIIANKY